METPEPNLPCALRRLAVALAEAQDHGADHDTLVHRLSAAVTPPRNVELVEDALLAAGQLLAGADPHLHLLREVWGAADLRSTLEKLRRELP